MTAHRDHPYRLSRRRLLGLTAAAAGLSATRWSPLAAFAQVQTTRGTLPNGLTVLVEERPSADTVALQLTARVGAREDGPVSGSALLTSRTMFQGTTHRPSESALQREAALVGGTVSRGTTAEQSFYASAMPSSEVDLAFDLLSDVVGDPLMDETAFARQKTIALQELAQRRTSSASQIEDVFLPAVFAGHPASSPVNGRAESIEVMQLDTLRGVREQYWGAANLVLVVVGRIAPADALDRAAQYLGALPSGTQNARRPVSQPGPTAGLVRSDAGQQQALFRIAYPAPGLLDADRAAMTVLNGMMASGSGRLYRELRTLRGLAYSAGSVYPTYTDAGAWYATAGVDPENLDEALSVTRAEIERLRREPPTAAEVEHTIGLVSGRQVLNDETNAARATRLSSQAVLGSEPIESFLPRVRAVTPADVLRVAQSYFAPEHAVTITVGPPQE